MTTRVRRYTSSDLPAVQALNERLEAHGIKERVWPESPDQLALDRGDPLSQEAYIAVDGDHVRGGVWLHEHDFFAEGSRVRGGWLKYPVAESLIDRKYGGIPAAMIMALMRRQPHLMALGMGSDQSPLAKLLAALRWRVAEVPFQLAPMRLGAILEELPALRRGRLGHLFRTLGRVGIGRLGDAPLRWTRDLRTSRPLRGISVIAEERFGDWSDAMWHEHVGKYALTAPRESAMLTHVYRDILPWLSRLHVRRAQRSIGWVTTAAVDLAEVQAPHPTFGRLRIGMIVDAFGDPSDALPIFAAALRHLQAQEVDLAISNQTHAAWRAALRSLGFSKVRGNFFLASAPAMNGLLARPDAWDRIFINRGDCDGPRWW